MAEHQGSTLSLEYAVLKFLNPGYQPEPWKILHSLSWGKVMAYNLGRNLESKIEPAILLKTLNPNQSHPKLAVIPHCCQQLYCRFEKFR
ncbi:MAG: penicillin acylase family protein [Nostoc sp. DedQUE12b]|uniref:penicillin acylase family protein n=1 Tax=Nostoc sp. DedQUE12b TaxID=3075398 RepID=UPI002AD59EF1|nr:penicillin acylase family protein [Nostoc sp. DedQUE12b]MDZ8087235.1 penicillin acylase family protein [Nostoc sp. DedQUE12b]